MAKTKYNPEKARAYYLAKKETIIAKERTRYAANREARAREARERRARDAVKISIQRTDRYMRDREKSRAYLRDYYARNKDRAAAWARDYRKRFDPSHRRAIARKRVYGLSRDDFREMWNLQAGRCAICFERLVDDGSRQAHVDHDHKTGLVRGILCVDCNVGLGRFKDNAEALRRAADYVGRLEPVRVYSNGR